MVNKDGKLLRLILLPGNQHEVKSAGDLLGRDLRGAVVNGDRGYISHALAHHIFEAGGIPNITQKESAANPLPYHKELGAFRRVVENFFCRIKRSRRVATRYDRLAVTYLSFVILSAIDDWIRF